MGNRSAEGLEQLLPLAHGELIVLGSRVALPIACAALACAALWLFADVQIAGAGRLNALFYTGSKVPLPAGPVGDATARVNDEKGYDGQYYRLIAHDPLNRRGFLSFVDSPRYRWRRIGIPALAWLLGAGNDNVIDLAYVALELAFVFAGAFWLAQYSSDLGRSPAWGLAFLAIPGVAISLDRMMVDGPLVALAVGLMLQESEGEPGWQVYAVLAAAPLIRETGFLLIAAWCAVRALERRAREISYGLACAIPALAWFLYTGFHAPPDATPEATWPLGGLIRWTLYALQHPVEAYGPRANAVLEFVALAGIWLAFGLAIRVAGARPRRLPEMIAIAFALFTSVIGYQDIWASAYGIGRTLSPLLLALALIGLRDRRVPLALPVAMIAPRIALQFAAEIRAGLRG